MVSLKCLFLGHKWRLVHKGEELEQYVWYNPTPNSIMTETIKYSINTFQCRNCGVETNFKEERDG